MGTTGPLIWTIFLLVGLCVSPGWGNTHRSSVGRSKDYIPSRSPDTRRVPPSKTFLVLPEGNLQQTADDEVLAALGDLTFGVLGVLLLCLLEKVVLPGILAQGPKGARGPQGIKGAVGLMGTPGTDGMQGDVGTMGRVGFVGSPGPKGIRGADGAKGPPGPKGMSGTRGPMGDPGMSGAHLIGPPGPPGHPGPDGNKGPPGMKGDKGEPFNSEGSGGGGDQDRTRSSNSPKINRGKESLGTALGWKKAKRRKTSTYRRGEHGV